jgi:hypothetical protein
VKNELEDQLLRGSIDMHVHVYPEISLKMRGRVDAVECAELSCSAGMRAIVIKSSMSSTAERARIVQKMISGIEVYGGITLNHAVGGLNPLAVDITGETGGKIVWMPTWGSRNDLSKSLYSNRYINRMKKYLRSVDRIIPGPEAGITILEGSQLKPVVKDIIQVARHHKMVIASGHLSIEESLVLVTECQKNDVSFLLTHPLNRAIDASIEDQKEVARRGGYIEHCFVSTMPMHMRLEFSVITEAIEKIGPEQTILSTDAVETWNPPPHEMMRMFIASLLYLGVGEESIRMMVRDNPRKILQLRETAVDTEENIEQ